MSGLQSPQQERARFALSAVERLLAEITEKATKETKAVPGEAPATPGAEKPRVYELKGHRELKSYSRALPFMIRANGLGQAAAFYWSKGGVHESLYKLLGSWLTSKGQAYSDKDNLIEGITEADMATYQRAQAEALLLMEWVGKFVTAYVREPDEPSSTDSETARVGGEV